MKDDEWNDINFRAKATIIICISDEILYNFMNEEIIAELWCKLVKPLHNEEFVKQVLHEEAVVHPSDEEIYAYFTTPQYL